MRKEPSSDSIELRKLPEGTVVKLNSAQGNWNEVNLLNGMTGWISNKYVKAQITNPQAEKDEVVDKIDTVFSSPVDQVLRDDVLRNATKFRDDVDIFLKQHLDIPDILPIAEEVAKLQIALGNSDFAGTQSAMLILKSRMNQIPAFDGFQLERNKERAASEIKALADSLGIAKRNNFFLIRFIAQNVTAAKTAKLLPILNDYKAAMDVPTLSNLSELNIRFDNLLNNESLRKQFSEVTAIYSESESQKKVSGTTLVEEDSVAITDRNKALLEGDGKELVLMFNANAAPHVIKNLGGIVVFDQGKANVCYLHEKPSRVTDGAVVEILGKLGAKEVQPVSAPCDETKLNIYDIVLGIRSKITNQKKSYIFPLLGLLEKNEYQILKIVSSQEIASLTDETGTTAKVIEDDINNGTRLGFGLIRTDNSSSVICAVTSTKFEGHLLALDSKRKQIEPLVENFSTLHSANLDAAFVSIKRSQCGALYAEAKDLALLMGGMKRDELHYKIIPIWLTPDQITSFQTEATNVEVIKARADAAKKQAIEEKESLKKKRENDLASSKDARETVLRSQYGASARARADEIDGQFKLMVGHQDGWFQMNFPNLKGWYSNQLADGWELVDEKTTISDYGTSSWKNRTLNAVAFDLSLNMKNRTLGENRVSCFGLIAIFDDEFNMVREPTETGCNSSDATSVEWKRAWSFVSQWRVQE
jgi:hypothetical protein